MIKEWTKYRKVYRSGGELGRPTGDLWDHVGSPAREMGRIWRLDDRLFTALFQEFITNKNQDATNDLGPT